MKLIIKYCKDVYESDADSITVGPSSIETLATLMIMGTVPQIGASVYIELADDLPIDLAAKAIIKKRNNWKVHSICHEYKVLKSTDGIGATIEEQAEVVLL